MTVKFIDPSERLKLSFSRILLQMIKKTIQSRPWATAFFFIPKHSPIYGIVRER